MTKLDVLFIGGTGIISTACAREAIARGFDVTILNRGTSTLRPAPEGATLIRADVRDAASVRTAIGDRTFDVVVNFVNFSAEHVQLDIELFGGRLAQYVFISSASAYQTPPTHLPVTESTPLRNPFWEYSRAKIRCEDVLVAEYRQTGFPVTIVRPSHTYDPTMAPFDGGWTVVERMRQGREVVVPGDGTSLWTITHHEDFARGFVGLLGKQAAIGEAFHITSHEALTWNQIYTAVADAAGVVPRLVHVPSDAIAEADPEWGAAMLGDKSHSMVFDNSKLRSVVPGFAAHVPFAQGAREIIAWHDADPARRIVDPVMDALFDKLVGAYRPRRAS